MRLVVASRQSELARLQAYEVAAAIQSKHSDIDIEFHFRTSLGDQNASDPLWKMPEKGVFTEDFYQGLVDETWDMVVHSWKDLPIEERADTEIAATLERADMRDLLLVKPSCYGKKSFEDFKILTSSPRREYNLSHCLGGLLPFTVESMSFKPVRGNVQTRLRKFIEDPEAQALVMAKAALDRLLTTEVPELQPTRQALRQRIDSLLWMVLPLSQNPCAAAQGALAIEVKRGRKEIKEVLSTIHCQDTYKTVCQERELLQSWGGGCHQKIGASVFERDYGQVIFAKGLTESGEIIDQHELATQETTHKKTFFPMKASQQTWFQRENLPATDWQKYAGYAAHWVSRSEALPEEIQLQPQKQIVWTSGLKTWKKLARRGIWVHGSSESLGEIEDTRLQALAPGLEKWCKWTHADGEPLSFAELAKSYRLVEKNSEPELAEATEAFYWMSGSSFRRALQVYPWLKNKEHWSGPGHTHQALHRMIKETGGQGSARIALNFEQWQKKMEQGDS